MAAVWIDEAGWEDGDLPDACLECGDHAPDRVKRTFTYQTPWAYLAILGGLLPLVIVLLVTRKQRRSRVPMCPRHENHWRKRTAWQYGSLLIALLLGTLGVVWANLALPNDAAPIILSVILVCVVGWLVALVVISWGTIGATKFSSTSIRLKNVSPDFVDAYEDFLDEEDLRDRRKSRIAPTVRERWNEPRRRQQPIDDDDDTPQANEKYRPR